jgi:hypothetical protein
MQINKKYSLIEPIIILHIKLKCFILFQSGILGNQDFLNNKNIGSIFV